VIIPFIISPNDDLVHSRKTSKIDCHLGEVIC